MGAIIFQPEERQFVLRAGYFWIISPNERRSELMSEPTQVDRAFSFIMKRMMETGQAPFYTEIAAELGVSVEEGRKVLHGVFAAGVPGWVYPNTNYIVSFAPFNNLPTQYRITIQEQQKWFGQ
jgi:hypothetical protein